MQKPGRKPRGRSTAKPGQLLRLEVTDIATGGAGEARFGRTRCTVWGGLPGDVVDARVDRLEGGFATTRVEQVVESTIDRIEPRCGHFGICGGCIWQDVDYETQLSMKGRFVTRCLARAGLEATGEVVGSPQVYGCRNRMDFSFGQHPEGRLMLGLFAAPWKLGANEPAQEVSLTRGKMPPVFDLEACHLQSDLSNQVVHAAQTAFRNARMRAYDTHSRAGLLRSMTVRDSKHSGDLLVNVMAARALPDGSSVEPLMACSDRVKGVVVSVNRKRSRHAAPKAVDTVAGEDRICERILGLDIEVSATSFLQVNTPQAERLYELALTFAGLTGAERVVDLYCGSGTLSLLLAGRAGSVTGVEILEASADDARRNAERNGVENCTFVAGDVAEVVPSLSTGAERVDVVTVNPPRAGVHLSAIRAICDIGPHTVVYVSCSAETLARDLRHFQAGGYGTEEV
ncbi:MAG: 23S rRNA (uracil(1939)-C(5))-methyltransferase RlmD, partial [Candidatus Latescibacteria bacterium]|nr:23S rRNA (uracil(1939)-C(5))-methyltransferase RlmD [Candidatus Latescibacterota bacterium]